MFEINPVNNRIQDLTERTNVLRGIFDYDAKKERLEEVNAELEQPDVWNEPERAQALGKERSSLEAIVDTLDQMTQGLDDVSGLLELAVEADDEETFNEAVAELNTLEEKLAQLEFRRMFSGEYDSADCYLDIQAGSGGTEAQDWASMLLRMYLRWAEARGFKTEVIEESEGKSPALSPRLSKSPANMPMVGCALKPAYIVWCVKVRLTPAVAVIPRLAPRLCTRKWTTISISTLTRRICVSMSIARLAQAVSTLTVRNPPCVSLIFPPGL